MSADHEALAEQLVSRLEGSCLIPSARKGTLGAMLRARMVELLADELSKSRISESFSAPGFTTSMLAVLRAVADKAEVAPGAVLGVTKARHVSQARGAVWYVLRDRLGLTFTQIAEVFGRDHTTVIYGVRRVHKAVGTDQDLAGLVRAGEEALGVAA